MYYVMEPVGLTPEIRANTFDPTFPHSYCRICGFVFQSHFQRTPVAVRYSEDAPNDSLEKCIERRDTMIKHERMHERDGSLAEYERSGYYFTPEATKRLIPYGIVPVSEIALHDEHAAAAAEAATVPTND